MSGPAISIALAAYNGERYIAEQLASLGAQTRAPHELVVCDDGSTDATCAIVEDFARGAPFPVRLIRNPENLGYAANFLTAASLCEAEWVAFCDQDDVWAPEKLERVGQAIGRHPEALLITHPAFLTDETGAPTGEVAWPSRERLYRRLSFNPWRSGMGCGQVFRAFLVKEVPWTRRFMFDPDRPTAIPPHDDWVLKLSQCLGGAFYMEAPLVYRRRHTSSVTAAKAIPLQEPGVTLRRDNTLAQLERCATLAADRIEVLEQCAEACAPRHRDALLDAARHYQRVGGVLERRAAWRRKGGVGRLAGAVGSVVRPQYWRMPMGVAGWRGLARDLIDLPGAGA